MSEPVRSIKATTVRDQREQTNKQTSNNNNSMAPIVVPDERRQQQVKVSIRANENNNDERVTVVEPPPPPRASSPDEPRPTSGGAATADGGGSGGGDKAREQQQRDFGATTTTMASESSGWSIQKAPGEAVEPEKLEEELETASRVGVGLGSLPPPPPLSAWATATAAAATETLLSSSRLSRAGSRLEPLKLCRELASSRAQDDEEGAREEASIERATGRRRPDSALTSLFAHVNEVQREASLLLSGQKIFRYSTNSSMSPNGEFVDSFTDVGGEPERKISLASLKVTTTTGDASNESQSVSPVQTPLLHQHPMEPFKLECKNRKMAELEENELEEGEEEEQADLAMLRQLMEKRSELRSLDRRLLNEMLKYLDRLGLASLTGVDNQQSSQKLQAFLHELGLSETLADSLSSPSTLEQPHSTSLSQFTSCLGHSHHHLYSQADRQESYHRQLQSAIAMDLSQMSSKLRLEPQTISTESMTKSINLKKARLLAAHHMAEAPAATDLEMSDAKTPSTASSLSTSSTAQIIKLDQRRDSRSSVFRFNFASPPLPSDLHKTNSDSPAAGTSVRLQHKKFRLGINMDESNATDNNTNSLFKHNTASNNTTTTTAAAAAAAITTNVSSIISEYRPNIAPAQQHLANFPGVHQLAPQSPLLAINPNQQLTPPNQGPYAGTLFSAYNDSMIYYPQQLQQLNCSSDKMTYEFRSSDRLNESGLLINSQMNSANDAKNHDAFQRHHHLGHPNLLQFDGYQQQQHLQAHSNRFDTNSSSAAAAAAAEAYAQTLQQHQRIAFRCHVCGSGFEDRHRLQQHLSIHLNLQPSWFEEKTIKETMAQYESKRGDYLCQACNLRYETTAEFDRHMQLHGDKPHRCELCEQDNKLVSFRYYRQLLTHLRSHCFLYSCRFSPECKQTANRKDYLKLHILKHHLNNKLPEQYTICCH